MGTTLPGFLGWGSQTAAAPPQSPGWHLGASWLVCSTLRDGFRPVGVNPAPRLARERGKLGLGGGTGVAVGSPASLIPAVPGVGLTAGHLGIAAASPASQGGFGDRPCGFPPPPPRVLLSTNGGRGWRWGGSLCDGGWRAASSCPSSPPHAEAESGPRRRAPLLHHHLRCSHRLAPGHGPVPPRSPPAPAQPPDRPPQPAGLPVPLTGKTGCPPPSKGITPAGHRRGATHGPPPPTWAPR